MSHAHRMLRLTVVLLGVANLLLIFLPKGSEPSPDESPTSNFTYIGNDAPRHFPHKSRLITMVLEESSRFTPITNSTLPNWWNNFPTDEGYVRLGPQKRFFTVSMNHQYHCLYRTAEMLAKIHSNATARLVKGDHSARHFQHCWNFLRENVLCSADTSWERGDWMCRDYELERTQGGVKVCNDWQSLTMAIRENLHSWREFKAGVFGP